MNSKVYKQVQEFMKTPQYKQAVKYLQKVDKDVHKDILQKIDNLQKELLKGNERQLNEEIKWGR